MPSMHRDRFFAEFDYQVEKDFDVDGVQASWADSGSKIGHRFWGDEDYAIEIPSASDNENTGSASAISLDGKLIATSSGHSIFIYHVPSKEFRFRFGGLTNPCQKLIFNRPTGDKEGYQLIIGSPMSSMLDSQILFFDLDKSGRGQQKFELLKISRLVEQSLHPLISEIGHIYDVPLASPLFEPVRADYTKALEKLQSNLESKDLVHLKGRIPGFGSNQSSADGRLLLYLIQNETTQHGSRPPAELPHIIVYDIVEHQQKHILGGHEDAIMWTAFSSNDQYIASASWDGTFRIFETATGDCKHVIGPTGGQCWSGAWSPDSNHVLLCGMAQSDPDENGRVKNHTLVAVFSAETGEQIRRFKHERLQHWVRRVAWSPKGEIAIAHETEVWIWNPFDDILKSSFALKIEERMMRGFARVADLGWADHGKLLTVRKGDGTVEVWNRDDNVKWRFQRPKGTGKRRHAQDIYWVEKQKTMISSDLDGVIRFYGI